MPFRSCAPARSGRCRGRRRDRPACACSSRSGCIPSRRGLSIASIAPRIWPASLPPPIASKARVAPVRRSASVSSAMKPGDAVLTTCRAPCARNSASCSGLRTTLTRPMPSARQRRLSICPRFDAAAVCTSARWPSRRIVSVIPSAVSGLTKHDAPSAALVPAGKLQAKLGLDRAVLRVHRAAEDGDGLAEQRLGRAGAAGAHHGRPRPRCRPASTGRAGRPSPSSHPPGCARGQRCARRCRSPRASPDRRRRTGGRCRTG